MPLNKTDMSEKIVNDMETLTNTLKAENKLPAKTDYFDCFIKSIKEYLEANTEIKFSWTGTLGTQTETTTLGGKISWTSFKLSQPENLVKLGKSLVEEIIKGKIEIIQPPPETTTEEETEVEVDPYVINGPIHLKEVVMNISSSQKADQSDAMLSVCTDIINTITTMENPGPYGGKHGSYSGAATMVSVT